MGGEQILELDAIQEQAGAVVECAGRVRHWHLQEQRNVAVDISCELADRWCARTGNTIVGADIDDSGVGTLVVRRGRLPDPAVDLGRDRMPGARLWLYTNFHCNLARDYCCVASSPQAPRRELGGERIARLVTEAAAWACGSST